MRSCGLAGDLDIHPIDLPVERYPGREQTKSIVASNIQIRDCDLLGMVNFEQAMLREGLDISGSIFRKEACFKGACMQGKAGFGAPWSSLPRAR
ncbi:Uncharacterised protein [uncultured archaeon]|nr:Uncharacterised protein [uncultured archaeon]